MARPSKSKKIGKLPTFQTFTAFPISHSDNSIILELEEYETIRLIDYLGLTQEECAAQMEIGRATVQSLYTNARKKIARFIIEGSNLNISGGNYQLEENFIKKGDFIMKIAVTYENGMVFQHFGHTEQFKIYNVEDGKIISSEIVNTNGAGHGLLAGFLKEQGVTTLICGGIGGGARNALSSANIEVFPGANGNVDTQVESFLAGNLSYDPNTKCNHHDHEEGHECGSHSHEKGHSCHCH